MPETNSVRCATKAAPADKPVKRVRIAVASLLAAWCIVPAARASQPYVTQGICGGFPRVSLQTKPGFCVGLVAEHLGFARGVAVIGHAIYVVDMGGWRKGHGRLLRLDHDGHDAPQIVLQGLDEPSALLPAPAGGLYLGLLDRVVRIASPGGPSPAMQDVLTGLPATGRHPLAALAQAPDGSLYVNIGSGTDHCESPNGATPVAGQPCREIAGNPKRAEIVRVEPGHATSWRQAETLATGLRNSMGLAVMPGGAVLAAVNERDAVGEADHALSDAALPNDVFDVVAKDADYGWPYCFDGTRANPEYKGHDCSRYRRPTLLLPPHAAPLGMLLAQSASLGLKGQVIMTYHGYRPAGHRLVGLSLHADGQPNGAPENLVWDWTRTTAHPQGAPVGVAEDADGSVLITEDHNSTLLRLARE